MAFAVVGLSHKTAPIELRERLAIPQHQLAPTLEALKELEGIQEAVVLSTCNRLEIYARPVKERAKSMKAVADFFQCLYDHDRLETALYHHEAFEAVKHLFRVASGLDSLVVGETEVLGQVKSAYENAQKHKATGKITNVLFQRALYVGKKVRAQTNVSEGASSVGSVAVQLAERIFGELAERRVLLLGAGEIAEITARHLLSRQAKDMIVLNRTLSKAQALAHLLKGEAVPMERLFSELIHADIVISSVFSDKPLITKKDIKELMPSRRGRSLYFIDIALPRNVDSAVHEIDNVYVYNIDDLQKLVDENMSRRHGQVQEAEKLVEAMARESYDWISATLDGKRVSHKHGPATVSVSSLKDLKIP